MKIDNNKDFNEAYPDEIFSGFTLKQCFFAALGFIVAAAVSVILFLNTNWTILQCTYIGIPCMVPICGIGFFEYQKHTAIQMLQAMKYVKKTRLILYAAGEHQGKNRVFRMNKRFKKKGRKK